MHSKKNNSPLNNLVIQALNSQTKEVTARELFFFITQKKNISLTIATLYKALNTLVESNDIFFIEQRLSKKQRTAKKFYTYKNYKKIKNICSVTNQ